MRRNDREAIGAGEAKVFACEHCKGRFDFRMQDRAVALPLAWLFVSRVPKLEKLGCDTVDCSVV